MSPFVFDPAEVAVARVNGVSFVEYFHANMEPFLRNHVVQSKAFENLFQQTVEMQISAAVLSQQSLMLLKLWKELVQDTFVAFVLDAKVILKDGAELNISVTFGHLPCLQYKNYTLAYLHCQRI